MNKKFAVVVAAGSFLSPTVFAQSKEPEIKIEMRDENGKEGKYMFINGIKVHEEDPAKQPQPPVVEPKPYDAEAAKPPAGAIVLFDGTEKTFSNWTNKKGEAPTWLLSSEAIESTKRAGYIQTKQEFGSCKLHIEFATPKEVMGTGQGRGNSGVFLMGIYEVQVLDSYQNTTYPDGQCGALYGRSVPLVNASRGPGEWQTYDITFNRPLFDENGKVTRKAKFHVVHNGHVIQDNVELSGGTGWEGPHAVSEYKVIRDLYRCKTMEIRCDSAIFGFYPSKIN
jgi:hypothetical protein